MKKHLLIILFIPVLLFHCAVNAQSKGTHNIFGIVLDSNKTGLQGCSIVLVTVNGDSARTVAGADGTFSFIAIKGSTVTISASSVGFKTFTRHYILDNGSAITKLDPIILSAQVNTLNPVEVVADNPVTIKEDTVTYKANAYKVRENAPVEDVIRKLPGVDVDANGNVTAQGKRVTKVRVNGKDFFNGDVQTATRNLPADVVENIQMIDDYGDQANLTGVKTGEPDKIMNITIRPDKNHGYTGQITAGDGEDALPKQPGVSNDNRYIARANAFRFNGNQQVSVLGNINNTNVNTFSFNSPINTGGGADLLDSKKMALDALMSGKLTGGGNFTNQASQQTGITNTHSAGFNYRDQWGKYLSVYGSYSFADNTVVTQSNTLQQNTSPISPGSTAQSNDETDRNINHRINWNMEYKPDTVNYLKVTPSFSYAKTATSAFENVTAMRNGAVNAAYTSSNNGNSSSPNYSFTALYNHRFNGHGRNLSLNINVNTTTSDQNQNLALNYTAGVPTAPDNQLINSSSHNRSYGISASYLEPLGRDDYVELNYAYNYSATASNKQTTVPDTVTHLFVRDSALSNQYNYTFITNRFGLNYRYVKKKYNYTIGLGVEPSTLSGNSVLKDLQTHANTFNLVPIARFVYNFNRNQLFSLNYNGYNSQPSFAQLQPVTDFSNALYPQQGNPNLKPSFTNNFSARYNRFDFNSGNSLFTNISFSQTQDQVVTNTITYPRKYAPNPELQNTYLTQYVNANGYYTASTYISYAKPWHKRRYTLMFNGTVAYTNNIGYLTSIDSITYAQTTQKNTARNIAFTPGVRFRVDIPDIIDAQLLTNYAISKTDNSVKNSFTDASSNIRTLTIGLSGKEYIKKDWTISYEYSHIINYGYTFAVTNPNILNAYIEYQFLKNKKATIRLAAFDLFNQNTGYSTTVTANAITQTNTNRLGRYYLATFTLRLQKFAGTKL